MVGAEAEALGHAAGAPPESAWNGLAAERTKTDGPSSSAGRATERPRDAMLALDRRTAVHADDGLADHDARTW